MTVWEKARSVSLVERKTLRLAVGWVMLTLNCASKPALRTDGRLWRMSPFLILN
jgi:hypothetical protein